MFWVFVFTPTSVGMTETFTLWERICMGIGAVAGPVALVFVVFDIVLPTWELPDGDIL